MCGAITLEPEDFGRRRMRISARVTGAGDLARQFEARAIGASAAVQIALEEAGTIVESEARRLIMDGPKTGRVYTKYNPHREHQASAPGEPPANDLGFLAANIVQDKADLAQGRIFIAALAKYAKFLEFGTARIAPRPFLRPALANMRGAVVRAFRAALARGRR